MAITFVPVSSGGSGSASITTPPSIISSSIYTDSTPVTPQTYRKTITLDATGTRAVLNTNILTGATVTPVGVETAQTSGVPLDDTTQHDRQAITAATATLLSVLAAPASYTYVVLVPIGSDMFIDSAGGTPSAGQGTPVSDSTPIIVARADFATTRVFGAAAFSLSRQFVLTA
jgi:hypothetical protein